LNYEEQFYLLMACFAALALFAKIPIQRSVALMAIPCLVWNLIYPSTSYGLFIEYWVHFAIGVLVFYRLCRPMSRVMILATDLGLLTLAIVSLLAWHAGPENVRWVYSEWTVVSFFALALIFLRRWDTVFKQSLAGRILCGFGVITYSLYLTHQFNLRPTRFIADKLVLHGMPKFLGTPAQMAQLVVIGFVFWLCFERPFLNRPLGRKQKNLPEKNIDPEPGLTPAR
jgi:peptidoglycan/LPS O-acetylase OafA/YrhL